MPEAISASLAPQLEGIGRRRSQDMVPASLSIFTRMIDSEIMRTASLVFAMLVPAWCAGPILSPEQIQSAIQEGRKHKTADKYFAKMKGAVKLSDDMNVTFFNDWQALALESAEASRQMRELRADEIHGTGLLHAYLKILTDAAPMFRQGKFLDSHLVLAIGDRVIQPAKVETIKNETMTHVIRHMDVSTGIRF